MADTTLTDEQKAELLETWKSLVSKRGRKNIVQVQIEQAEAQMANRQKFIDEAKDEASALGNRVELEIQKALRDNLAVELQVLDIEITALKVALGAADKGDLSDTVKKSMEEDAKDVDEA